VVVLAGAGKISFALRVSCDGDVAGVSRWTINGNVTLQLPCEITQLLCLLCQFGHLVMGSRAC
jgi:hypothetical protein